VGDWIISNGTAWEKVDLTDAVSSVFGRTGAVVGVSTDYSAVGLTNTAIGAANPSSGAFTSLSSSSTTTLNGTTVPASKTLVVTTDKLSALAATTSAELAGVISDETGSGALVFATSPTLVTPALGTPSALVGTNITGTASGLTAGNVTTNANLTGAITSVGNATSLGSFTSANLASALTDETGSGANVFANSPTLVTPILGTPQSGTLTSCTGLPISTGVSGLGTGIATALAVNTGSAGAPVLFNGALGTPTSGTVTNLTGTASININGTVGATTPSTGAFTTLYQGTAGAQGLNVGFSGAAGQGFTLRDTTNSRTYFVTTETATGLQINAGANPISLLASSVAVTGALSASGLITSTNSGRLFNRAGASTAEQYFQVANSGGDYFWGVNDSAAVFAGGTAYSLFRYVPTGRVIQDIVQGTAITTTSATGLAVTGALSATGSITTTAGSFFGVAGTYVLGAGAEGLVFGGSTAAILRAPSGTSSLRVGNTDIASASASGLAVTGALSSTGDADFGGVGSGRVYAEGSSSSGNFVSNQTSGDSTKFHMVFRENGTERGSITSNGTVVAFNTSSDRRLKENIRNLTNSAAIVDALAPRIYDWKSGEKDTYGFVAQEVFSVFPQAVMQGDDDPDTIVRQWGLDYSKLVPVLVAELQSVRARLAALESK
jgi:hypothetical protein